MICQNPGCNNELTGKQRRWCSQRCRGSRICIDCGEPHYTSGENRPRCHKCQSIHQAHWTPDVIVAAIRAWAKTHDGVPPAATNWNWIQALALGHPEKAEEFHASPPGTWPSVDTVQRIFGSWNEAIAAAGFLPTSVGRYDRKAAKERRVCVQET